MKKKFAFLMVLIFVACFSVPTVTLGNEYLNKSIIEKQIQEFYRLSYDMYLSMEKENFDTVLDLNTVQSKNYIISLDKNITAWKYSIDKGYTKVVRERYPIYFNFKRIDISNDQAIAIVDITGKQTDALEAYPPFVVFGENKFIFNLVDSEWLIAEHEYEGDLFEVSKTNELDIVSSDELYNSLESENKGSNVISSEYEDPIINAYPYTDYSFNRTRAVNYANNFVINPNSYFYTVSGNDCTNFVSQCISYGFGGTSGYTLDSSYREVLGLWSAGSGGGYLAWESVYSHWQYMTRSKPISEEGPRVSITSWSSLLDGGVMQIDFTGDGSYDHSVICVSRASEKFAQHTSNRYRYYIDYTGSKRFYQPTFYREY